MFAEIGKYQKAASELLAQQLRSGALPQALLLSGSRYSGRMHIALEIARVLSCSEQAHESCSCSSCKSYAHYAMRNVVSIGNRDHSTRIAAALARIASHPHAHTRQFLLYTVHLMLLQFHGALLGSTDAKSSPIFEAAAVVNDLLSDIEQAPLDQLPSLAIQLESALQPFAAHMKKAAPITIAQIRSLQEWALQTSSENPIRVMILEGVEESTAGSRNSLLKLLEEPPKDTYIILLSEHPARLLPTIHSRVQPHPISPLSQEATSRLLREVFSLDDQSFSSVEQFFLELSGVPCRELAQDALRFALSLASQQPLTREELDAIIDKLDEQVHLEYFLKQVQQHLRLQYLAGNMSIDRATVVTRTISEAAHTATIFNQSKKLLIESMHYQLQEKL
jgi:DNA polymerase-3 subunit gamma/tau